MTGFVLAAVLSAVSIDGQREVEVGGVVILRARPTSEVVVWSVPGQRYELCDNGRTLVFAAGTRERVVPCSITILNPITLENTTEVIHVDVFRVRAAQGLGGLDPVIPVVTQGIPVALGAHVIRTDDGAKLIRSSYSSTYSSRRRLFGGRIVSRFRSRSILRPFRNRAGACGS